LPLIGREDTREVEIELNFKQYYLLLNKSIMLINKNIFPNNDFSVRLSKLNLYDYLKNGRNHRNYVELVPVKNNTKKVFKLTSQQFEILYMVLLTRKSNEDKLGDDNELDI
jgi:hypothetical protein